MIEEKCFQVPERVSIELIAEELNKAFGEGWRYIAHFPVDRGTVLVLTREAAVPASNGKAKARQMVKSR